MQNRQNILFIGIIIIVAIAAVIFAVVWTSSHDQSGFTAGTASAVSATDHTEGPATSTVSLIEYGDFQCPACGAYEPLVEQLKQDYAGKVLFVFRNFPLTNIHPNAMLGAEAAEAAGLQNKYWEMHNKLFTEQATWSVASPVDAKAMVDGYAKDLGLDVAKFDADMQSAAVADKIQADTTSGNAASINHTPTFFINLTEIPNPQSYGDFTTSIDNALKAAS